MAEPGIGRRPLWVGGFRALEDTGKEEKAACIIGMMSAAGHNSGLSGVEVWNELHSARAKRPAPSERLLCVALRQASALRQDQRGAPRAPSWAPWAAVACAPHGVYPSTPAN